MNKKVMSRKIKCLFVALLFAISVCITGVSVTTYASTSVTKSDTDAPDYDITINIVPQTGWQETTSKVAIKVIDNKNTGTFSVVKLEAKIGSTGSWEDITETGYIEVSENCTIYARATDAYGTVYNANRFISSYDSTAPTFNCAITKGTLKVTTNDNESGVEYVYINGYKFSVDEDGSLEVRLQKFDASYKNFTVYVTDYAGNQSDSYTFDNPYYEDTSSTEDSEDSGDESTTESVASELPDSVEPSDNAEASATVTSVTDENGNDISESVSSKQFYTITTSNGQTFYLIIDLTSSQSDGYDGDQAEAEGDVEDDGTVNSYEEEATAADTSEGKVYFLSYISNDDLLNITGNTYSFFGQNSLATDSNIDDSLVTSEEEASSEETTETSEITEEAATEESNSGNYGTIIAIVLFVIVAFVAIMYKTKNKGKSKTPEIEDDFLEEDYSGETNTDDYEDDDIE